MVGYAVGLGDRHLENILIDSTTGGLMHVDFACLFDHGLNLETPEQTPFRLTPNLQHAMGVRGADGIFRQVWPGRRALTNPPPPHRHQPTAPPPHPSLGRCAS